MHQVLRKPEPSRLKAIRNRYTKGWVDHYRHRVGDKPTDSRWREFAEDVSACFYGCCGYCEIRCRGEIDHYKPKSKFPELVYVWENWVFACHDCNMNKLEVWPDSGFLDPCCRDTFCDVKGSCFVFDLKTGEVLPNPDLSRDSFARARQTTNILGLNLSFRLAGRLEHISRLDDLKSLGEHDPALAARRFMKLAQHNAPLCSLTIYYLNEVVCKVS